MAKVTIIRRTDSERKDGKSPLYAVLNINRIKIRLPVNVAVSVKEWDPASERVKGRTQEAKDKNLIISNTKAKIYDILVRARLTGETLTKDRFLILYHRPAETMNFLDFAFRRIEELRPAMQPETIRHQMAILKKLRDYNANIQFGDITPEWLRVYAAHLRTHHNNSTGTIGKNMSAIRTHYLAALRLGKVKSNPFEIYKIPHSDPTVVYLTEDEFTTLIALYKSDTLPNNEQDALRFFLFMTFTGMHISDARALMIDQIFGGEIHYRRIKTHTRVNMPVSSSAATLIEHYQSGRTRGNLFQNLPTDQAFNRLIKRVCNKAGIKKPISAKAARHTFATLYYKKNHGDLGTLSKLLGHTSINTTMIYAHILKEERVAGVAVFDGLL